MGLRILYITTFNREIFEASGRKMLESFFSTKQNGDILCCYEGINPDKSFKNFSSKQLKFYNLSESKFLNNWLKENEDVIPIECGGKASKDKKPQAYLGWNFRAAGWFRKIATFEYAINISKNYDAIIFVDSDSKFTNKIEQNIYEEAFNKSHYFYHWGKERRKKELGVESGFIGFRTSGRGLEVLNYWINKFRDKTFRRYMRWDDGGMFSNVLYELEFSDGNDLVTNYVENGKSQSHVIERGIFKQYVIHDKGLHKRLGLTNEKK